MAVKKYYSIKFPFTTEDRENFFVDLASDHYVSIKQDLTHLLFTPKKQKLRDSKFGTNLIKELFQPNDSITQTDIKVEMQTIISRYFPNVSITKLDVVSNENDRGVTVELSYEINEGTYTVTDQIKHTI